MKKTYIILIAFCVILVFVIGWVGNMAFSNITFSNNDYQRKVAGLYITSSNESETKNLAMKEDRKGDWVCVNIRGMDYKRALEVCSHEVGHEIFAEKCESNPNLCFELLENKNLNKR